MSRLDNEIRTLVIRLTGAGVSYGWVTGHGPVPSNGYLENMKRYNPRAYGWLMEYIDLVEYEKSLTQETA